MFLKTFRSGMGVLTCVGLTMLAPCSYAGYPISDPAQLPTAVLEEVNTLYQQIQFFDIGSTARSIYTIQGDVRDLRNKWGSYLKDFNWFIEDSEKENYKPVIDKSLCTGQKSTDTKGETTTTAATQSSSSDAATLKKNIEKTMMVPIDSEEAAKITDQEFQNIKTAQRVANRNAVLNGYSLGLAVQEEAANFEDEKLPAVRQMSNNPETLTEGVAAQTETLNLIASQININNLLKASALEVLSTEVLKQMDG